MAARCCSAAGGDVTSLAQGARPAAPPARTLARQPPAWQAADGKPPAAQMPIRQVDELLSVEGRQPAVCKGGGAALVGLINAMCVQVELVEARAAWAMQAESAQPCRRADPQIRCRLADMSSITCCATA